MANDETRIKEFTQATESQEGDAVYLVRGSGIGADFWMNVEDGLMPKYLFKTGADTIDLATYGGDLNIIVNGTFTLTLSNKLNSGRSVNIINSGSGVVTLAGSTIATVLSGNSVTILSDGTNMIGARHVCYNQNGNLGLGRTAESWDSSLFGVDVGGTASLFTTKAESAGSTLYLGQNVYYDGSYKRKVTDETSMCTQKDGVHRWYSDISGTADIGFTPTQRMILDSSGNLGLATNPQAWDSGWNAIEVGVAGAIASENSVAGAIETYFTNNVYYDGAFKPKNSGDCGFYALAGGVHSWLSDTGVTAGIGFTPTERMRLTDDGKLLVGTTVAPSSDEVRQVLYGGASASYLNCQNTATGTGDGNGSLVGISSTGETLLWNTENLGLRIGTNNLSRILISAAGHMSFNGITPKAYSGSFFGMDMAGAGTMMGNNPSGAANSFYIGQNFYYDGDFKRKYTDEASIYIQGAGDHRWLSDVSGTADTIYTPTERMRLSLDGVLSIGNTSPKTWDSNYRALQIGRDTSLWGSAVASSSILSNHLYFDGAWKFLGSDSGYGSAVTQANGVVSFNTTTAAGTDGNSATLTERMRLTQDGRLLVGTATAPTLTGLNSVVYGSTGAYTVYQDAATGTGNSNGFLVGYDDTNNAILWNYENTPINFATNGIIRTTLNANGYLLHSVNLSGAQVMAVNNTNTTGNGLYAQIASASQSYYAMRVYGNAGAISGLEVRGNGRVFLPATYGFTTATAANLVIGAGGDLTRSTSSRKHKMDERPLEMDTSKIYNIELKTFNMKAYDEGGELIPGELGHGPIAEDIALVEPNFATYDPNGDPEANHINNIVYAQNEEIKKLKMRLEALENA